MPYIKKERRGEVPVTAGELNYAITTLLLRYIEQKGESYQVYNDCMGALEGSKLELYRRRIAPYEEGARERNGDIYDQARK